MMQWVKGLNDINKWYQTHTSQIKVLKEGILFKRGGMKGNKGWQRRVFVLRRDFLSYYAGEERGAQHYKGKISLYQAKVEDTKTEKANSFQVITKERTFILAASSGEEKIEWTKEISKRITAISTDIDSIVVNA